MPLATLLSTVMACMAAREERAQRAAWHGLERLTMRLPAVHAEHLKQMKMCEPPS